MQNPYNTALKNNSLFKDINLTNISLEDLNLKIIHLDEGEVLYKNGDSAFSIYLVLEGEINLLKKKSFSKTSTEILSPNEFFGQTEFFQNSSRKSTALAIRDTKLAEISKEILDTLLIQHNGIFNNLKEQSWNWGW